MAFGDILKTKIRLLSKASTSKNGEDAFWVILRDIAVEDIKAIYPSKVDSNLAVPLYYDILLKNADVFPEYFNEVIKSNNQERFRVINRNLFTSNAFHKDGLANQKGIIAVREMNSDFKGEHIIFQGDGSK